MKLLSFTIKNTVPRIGALVQDENFVVDFNEANAPEEVAYFKDMIAFIEGGEQALEHAQSIIATASEGNTTGVYALNEIQFLAPVPRPPSMRCFSVYEAHLKNSIKQAMKHFNLSVLMQSPKIFDGFIGTIIKKIVLLKGIKVPKAFYERPLFYKGNPLTVVGHQTEIQMPYYTQMLDYELELGFYIGKKAKNVSEAESLPYIFGYTCYNDVSARDALVGEFSTKTGPNKGKDFDTSNIMGPWIVTADEIGDPHQLKMEVRINGIKKGEGIVGSMFHKIGKLIEFSSQATTLYPGEFFGCGTVESGCGMESWEFLKPGDIIELEIEKIGILKNKIAILKEKIDLKKARAMAIIAE